MSEAGFAKARRSKSLEVLIAVLDLKGISTGDFAAVLSALLGRIAWPERRRPVGGSRAGRSFPDIAFAKSGINRRGCPGFRFTQSGLRLLTRA